MVKDNTVPLQDIFGGSRSRSKAPQQNQQSAFMFFSRLLRGRPSITILELESLKEAVQSAALSYNEVIELENLARSRALACERNEGWHAGFGDFHKFLVDWRSSVKS